MHGRGAANEAVERHVVHAVVRGTAPNKVQRGIQVGAGVLAQGQAGVSGYVPVLVGLVEGPAEAGVRGPGGDVLFQGVGKVHPAKAPQVFYELRQISQNTTGGFLEKDKQEYLVRNIGVVTSAEDIENTLIGQGPWGGNIDTRDIAAGHKIHLHASHPGGLLFLGDVHASQGDSELTGIADETAADVTISCDVLKGVTTPGVCRIEKPDSLVQVDSARNAGGMEAALNSCFMNMMRWLVDDHGMERREAYLHMSANSGVRINVYQFVSAFFTCGVEFPKRNL